MKLVRFGEIQREKPGVIDATGVLRDASSIIDKWSGNALDDDSLARVRAAMEELPIVDSSPRLGAPVCDVGKVVGIGLNYRAHAAEAGLDVPIDPIIFLMAPTAINGPTDDIILPRGSVNTDWEVELAVIIGKGGAYIAPEDALSHVAGYCVANDVTERDYQLNRGTQWTKGKSADTFLPLGPILVTRDEVPDPQNLHLELFLNGELQQRGHSADMIFTVAELISRVSEYMSWQPGDVMITGTPPGVGLGMSPPQFLRDGDMLCLRINNFGEQCARVRAAQ
ncbi:fumarylacetoacetate hydrolase family protein [Candidatus Persebacteraceae bacterium Df01]|jgi:ureidoglycolate lyase|uniref:Fumarylacetoacetate hydrolase family protein n=1 Tax=Candidatus Doriopsillibacter californiensis TaxID=2970740 RepID=A0ABT7QK16_9GAMM|nr:fumarylacetoacetate hydrolase family protein [Candidatus Persebacteraceae bacterium Df01]